MSFMQGMGWGVVLGVVLVLAGIIVGIRLMLRRHGMGRRDGDVAAVAKELDLEFLRKGHVPEGVYRAVEPSPGAEAADRLPLPFFRRRSGWDELDYVLTRRGDITPQLWIGDYTLVPDERDLGREVVVTVTILESRTLSLPPFALRPSNLQETNVNEDVAARRFAIRFKQDEDEGIYQEFRENYLLLPDPEVAFGDEDAIRTLFNEPLRAFFSERWALSVEGAGRWLLIYREHTQVEWQDLENVHREAYEIFEHFTAANRHLAEVRAHRKQG